MKVIAKKKKSLILFFYLNAFIVQLEGYALHMAIKTLQAYKMSFRFELHRIVHLRGMGKGRKS